MKPHIIDLHCDTILFCFERNQTLPGFEVPPRPQPPRR